jgi:hypothetical protein
VVLCLQAHLKKFTCIEDSKVAHLKSNHEVFCSKLQRSNCALRFFRSFHITQFVGFPSKNMKSNRVTYSRLKVLRKERSPSKYFCSNICKVTAERHALQEGLTQ